MKLSFKQYLESKEQLCKAIAETPVAVNEYEVKKYCSLKVGESKVDEQNISLKPKHKVIIEWRYDNPNDPTVMSVKFVGLDQVDETFTFATSWTGKKLQKWLQRHAKDKNEV